MKLFFIPVALVLLSEGAKCADLVITTMADVNKANSGKYNKIIVSNLHVPANVTLKLAPKSGSTVVFDGTTTFGFEVWQGPLIRIEGKKLMVTGAPGHLIDCQGDRWWDGKGGNGGVKKPKFIQLRLENSVVSGLNVKNTPVHGFSVNSCKNLTISGINMDNSEGHRANGGHNTDGFDVGESSDVTIRNCVVNNQDDCLAINSGENILFEENTCIGGHGISIGSVGGRKNNVVKNVTIRNCVVVDSNYGIRIKTVSNAVGMVKNCTYENVHLLNIKKVGITMQGNYLNGGPRGDPTDGVPISGITIKNVHGNVDKKGTNYLIWVSNASNWSWDSDVKGGTKNKPCKGFPSGVPKLC